MDAWHPKHVEDYDTIKWLWKWKCIRLVTLLWYILIHGQQNIKSSHIISYESNRGHCITRTVTRLRPRTSAPFCIWNLVSPYFVSHTWKLRVLRLDRWWTVDASLQYWQWRVRRMVGCCCLLHLQGCELLCAGAWGRGGGDGGEQDNITRILQVSKHKCTNIPRNREIHACLIIVQPSIW
jgi:hypothetical protein